MAKRIVDEEMKFDIIINGDSAKKELFDLEKSTRKLTEENKALALQKKELEKANKQETEEYKELSKTIRENNKEIKENRARMSELHTQIGITGLTLSQLTTKATQLRLALRNMVPGSEDFNRYSAELRQINTRIAELNGRARETRSSLGIMADGFNRYAALGASIIATFTGVIISLQQMITYNGKLSDAQGDVMKTTKMTKEEVDELTKSFGLFVSRSQRMDLLGIAEQGGKVGIAKDEILSFVQVMDKASVALGDSFTGGPEEVAEKLGKIKFLFEETKGMGVEEAYMAIGSAINDLGADGVASERNIAEFTTRIGSLTDVLKPTVMETLALGAAFEESGIEAEVSSRAYNIFMKQASTEVSKFAKVMNLTPKAIENMINTNPLEFMLKFSEGLKGMEATDVAKTLDYLGLNADGANKAIGAMGNNTARFRELLLLSNDSFKQGTSLIDEYNIKNNTLGATLDKIKKKVVGWFSSDGLVAFLAASAEWFGKVVGATDDADGSGQKWRNTLGFIAKALAVVIAALITSTGWMKLTALWTSRNTEATLLYNLGLKARAVIEAISIAGTQAWAAAQMLLRGNIAGATQALRVMTAAMLTTPWGLILGLVAAVSTAYILFSDNAEKASASQKMLSDLHLESKKNIQEEVNELEMLRKVAQNELLDRAKREEALKRMNDIIPDYLGLLTLENIKTQEGIDILKKHTAELYANSRAKAAKDKFDELSKQRIDVEGKTSKDYESWMDNTMNAVFGETDAVKDRSAVRKQAIEILRNSGKIYKNEYGNDVVPKAELDKLVDDMMGSLGLKNKEKELESIAAQMKLLEKEIQGNIAKGLTPIDPTKDKAPGFTIPGGKEDKAADKAQKEHEKRMDDLLKQMEELRDLKRKGIDEDLSLMKEGFEKDVALQNESHNRKLEDLKRQLISEKDIKAADNKINNPDLSKQDVQFWTKQKEIWLEKNKHLNTLIRLEESIHYNKLGVIVENEHRRQLKKLDEKFKLDKAKRETDFYNQMSDITSFEQAKELLKGKLEKKQFDKITTLEKAKKALKKIHDKEELEQELIFIENSIGKMNQAVANVPFMGLDLNLLSPEQREKIENDIAYAKLAAAKIKAAINGESAPGDEASLEERDDSQKKNFEGFNGGTDVLGFTPQQWQETWDNLDTTYGKMMAGAMLVKGLQNAWGAYDTYVSAAENNRVRQFDQGAEKKKASLKRQLDNGFISQVNYNQRVEQIDKEVEKKKAEIEYKQAKRKKMMSIVDTIINTSVAIMQAYSQLGPIGGTVAAVVIGTLGALQLKTIAEQPLPARGYEEGLYPEYVKREQDGKVFKSRYGGKTRSGMVNRPTHFLTGENGPEMIIDSNAYRNLSPETRDNLERELRRIKGFEGGYYNNNLKQPRYEVPAEPTAIPVANSNVSQEYLMSVISRNSDVMERLLKEGVVAYYNKDPRDLQKQMDDMERIRNSKTKAIQ